RADADPARVARSTRPFDPAGQPAAQGFSLALVLVLLALATLLSEDLACVAAGVLAARGSVPFVPAMVACYVGIVAGDQLLYLLGRTVGRAVVRLPPVSWLLSEEKLTHASHWFDRHGLRVVLTSRFIPGSRFPTYVAAGVLRAGFLRFAGYLAVAGALWTPGLVGASYLATRSGRSLVDALPGASWPWAIAGVVAMVLLARLVSGLLTHRGRRMLLGTWRRWTRWEYWPMWLFYPPVVLYVLWLGIRHRSLTLFTAADPGIPLGGVVGESKSAILAALGEGDPRVAITRTVGADVALEDRIALAERMMAESGLRYPVICKPDVGERGDGVVLVPDRVALERYLRAAGGTTVLQEYVPGEEFGVFYWRMPGSAQGSIFSITAKRLPQVTGDGVRTLEMLILDDPRLVAQAPIFLTRFDAALDDVPAAGARIPLGDRGNHCQGALFLDGTRHATPALVAAIERLARRFEGFYVGRFDIRVPDLAALEAGRDLVVIELNGVTSEATHIYDPALGVVYAWRTLFAQWRILFAVGAANVARGARPASIGEVFRALRTHWARPKAPPAP
ncbi:MAG TPA: VTT domain-containing protein, partial [Gemmatimonadales bacterium]|nr:VTT domain-containing protein [Gemmatimonadales bacterium]